MLKISKGTIIRSLVLTLVVLNMILQKFGIDPLGITETQIGEFINMVVSVGAILAAWWKNNSVTRNAIRADFVLDALKNDEEIDLNELKQLGE